MPKPPKFDTSKLAYIKQDGPKPIAVYPAIGKTRPFGKSHPEEEVRLNAYNELITKYGYPPEFLDIEYPVLIREDEQPRAADIVVFDDKAHKRPFIVVEAKKPNRTDGERQGQRYATILRAVYVLWTNGSDRSCSVLVNRYPEEAVAIKDVPRFGGEPKYAIEKLEPFKDDKQVTAAFNKCHDLIWSLSNLKPDAAFTEFLKILLVKFEDETRESDYEFQILLRGQPPQPEPANETAQRVRLLFKMAVEHEAEFSAVFKDSSDIKLTNECIAQLVKHLQRFTFSETPVDQKGRAFETFLSGELRQEFKEFMTPRPVIEAVIAMAAPDTSASILDPCCGSGAFLVYSLQYIRKRIEGRNQSPQKKIKAVFDFAHDRLYGFDVSEQMAAVARINMLVNEDGRAHIFKHNSLVTKTSAPFVTQGKSFDFIFTNPPFGKKISQPSDLLESFQITRDEKGKVRNREFITEVLFLERNLEWLKPGGLMFIVLPDSVLGNSTLASERLYIEKLAKLKAIFSLSADTFGPSGAKSKTSIVVLEKRVPESEPDPNGFPVFIAHVPNVGYDFTGRATGKNELPQLVAEYRQYVETGASESPISRVVKRSELGNTWLAQPHLSASDVVNGGDASTLDDLCTAISTGKTAPRKAYTTSGLHMVKVGNLTGRGIEWESVERQFVDESFAEKYTQGILQKGDILFTAAAHGPKGIGLKVDIFEGAPKHIADPVLCCGEVMICRPKKGKDVDPYYLLLFLRSSAGYEAIQKCIRGQSGHIYAQEVRAIRIPKPAGEQAERVKAAVAALRASLKSRKFSAEKDAEAKQEAAFLFPSSVKKPVIAS